MKNSEHVYAEIPLGCKSAKCFIPLTTFTAGCVQLTGRLKSSRPFSPWLKSYPQKNVTALSTSFCKKKSLKKKLIPGQLRNRNVENISPLLNDNIINSTFPVSLEKQRHDASERGLLLCFHLKMRTKMSSKRRAINLVSLLFLLSFTRLQ